METRAPFIIVGALVFAAIGAVFGFVYWLHNTGGTGARTVHHIQFDGSVSGLLVGAAVLIPLILGYTAWSYWVFRGKVGTTGGYH